MNHVRGRRVLCLFGAYSFAFNTYVGRFVPGQESLDTNQKLLECYSIYFLLLWSLHFVKLVYWKNVGHLGDEKSSRGMFLSVLYRYR